MLLSWGLLQVGNLIPSQNEMYIWKGLAWFNIDVLLPCPPPETDETYTSYLPTNSMPLERLLGTKVYLELNLLSPYPEAVLIVNYCIAYPRSARNALVFIYKGSAQISILGLWMPLGLLWHQPLHLLKVHQPIRSICLHPYDGTTPPKASCYRGLPVYGAEDQSVPKGGSEYWGAHDGFKWIK